MRNYYRTLSVGLLCVAGLFAAADTITQVQPITGGRTTRAKAQSSPNRASLEFSNPLVTESFDDLVWGTNDNPDDKPLATTENIFINPEYTDYDGWAAFCAYSAGGAINLHNQSYPDQAWLSTALGDWSGRITVTFRAKALPNSKMEGANVWVFPRRYGYDINYIAETDDDMIAVKTVRLYPSMGWTEIKATFDNYSADADGHIQILAAGNVLIDDIKISCDTNAFIAEPHISAVKDFTDDSFTVTWDPVRYSSNYYIDLFEKREDPDAKQEENINFDDNYLSKRFKTTPASPEAPITVVENEGKDSSKGLRLYNGDMIEFDNGSLMMQDFKAYLAVVAKEGDYTYTAPNAPEMPGNLDIYFKYPTGQWFLISSINKIDLKNYLNGIEEYHGEETGSTDYHYFDVDDWYYNYFANMYGGVRFQVRDLPEGAYLVMDDITVKADPTVLLVRPDDTVRPGDINDPYAHTALVESTEPTSYTFTNLKPDTEYYFRVRSHYVHIFSAGEPKYAFGVATPKVNEPEIKSDNSYDLTWSEPAKATEYEVKHYGVTYSDGSRYSIFRETFDKIDAEMTPVEDPYEATWISNYYSTPLDKYTDNKGWYGMNTYISQGMCGIGPDNGLFNQMMTPEIDLSHNEKVNVRIKAYGKKGDWLCLVDENDEGYTIELYADENDNGYLDHSWDFDFKPGENKRFTIYSQNQQLLMLDEIEFSQDVPEGRHVYNALDIINTQEPKCSFTQLPSEYDSFAYTVRAITKKGEDVAYSNPSALMEVNLKTGKVSEGGNEPISGVEVITPATEAQEVARYSIDGRKLSAPTRGINIVVYSDGTVRKTIIK